VFTCKYICKYLPAQIIFEKYHFKEILLVRSGQDELSGNIVTFSVFVWRQ
jgi:hypothetical protein